MHWKLRCKVKLKNPRAKSYLVFLCSFVLFLEENIFESRCGRSIPFILCSNPKQTLWAGSYEKYFLWSKRCYYWFLRFTQRSDLVREIGTFWQDVNMIFKLLQNPFIKARDCVEAKNLLHFHIDYIEKPSMWMIVCCQCCCFVLLLSTCLENRDILLFILFFNSSISVGC